eukprot:c21812_g1_i2 orf=468-875(+)
MAQLLETLLTVFLSLLLGGLCVARPTNVERSLQGKVYSKFYPDEAHTHAENELTQLNSTDWEIFPASGLQNQFFNVSERRLREFHICALCTCCTGLRRFCIPTACCYTITCGSPKKPFGFCSFTPVACNCLSCHL